MNAAPKNQSWEIINLKKIFQVNLSEHICSRFDILLCVVQDEVELRNSFSTSEIELIPQYLLKKYIIYAKKNIHLKLHRMDKGKVLKICHTETRVNGKYSDYLILNLYYLIFL